MLDAETKRRIGVLGTAALSSLAQRGTMLSPPTRLNTAGPIEAFHGLTPTAKCCRRFAARLESPGWRPGDYHYLYRRPSGAWQFGEAFRGFPWSTMLSPPVLCGSTLRRAFHGLTPTAKCWRRVRGSVGTPGLAPGGLSLFISSPIRRMAIWEEGLSVEHRAVAAYAAQLLRRAFHGLTPTAKCWRRIRGSSGTPGRAPGDYHY